MTPTSPSAPTKRTAGRAGDKQRNGRAVGKRATGRAPQPAPRSREAYITKTTHAGPNSRVIVFLHGGGQEPNNEVLSRLMGGLESEGIAANVLSLPHETVPNALDRLMRTVDAPIILAGHSAGGAMALFESSAYADKIAAVIAINPAGTPRTMRVPTLILRGTNDFMFTPGGARARRNVTSVSVEGSDHSLRFRSSWQTREETSNSPATLRMNRGVARTIGEFLASIGQ